MLFLRWQRGSLTIQRSKEGLGCSRDCSLLGVAKGEDALVGRHLQGELYRACLITAGKRAPQRRIACIRPALGVGLRACRARDAQPSNHLDMLLYSCAPVIISSG